MTSRLLTPALLLGLTLLTLTACGQAPRLQHVLDGAPEALPSCALNPARPRTPTPVRALWPAAEPTLVVALTARDAVVRWNLATCEARELRLALLPGEVLLDAALTAAGERLVTASRRDGLVTLRLWDPDTGATRGELDRLDAAATTLRLSPDGAWLAHAAPAGGPLRLRAVSDDDARALEATTRPESHAVTLAALAIDGQSVTLLSTDAPATPLLGADAPLREVLAAPPRLPTRSWSLEVWRRDEAAGALVAAPPDALPALDDVALRDVRAALPPTTRVALSSDGLLIVASGERLEAFALDADAPLEAPPRAVDAALPTAPCALTALAVSAAGDALALGCEDGSVYVARAPAREGSAAARWRLHGAQLAPLRPASSAPITAVAFSPAGRSVLAGDARGALHALRLPVDAAADPVEAPAANSAGASASGSGAVDHLEGLAHLHLDAVLALGQLDQLARDRAELLLGLPQP